MSRELILRYGCNPHQSPARVFMPDGDLPLTVLNGAPGYINLLDALNSWQLVQELTAELGLPAAASFKHVSPAGAAVGTPLNDVLKKSYQVEGMTLSPLACAYVRARGADMMSSFGDWAALSDVCDVATAQILKREVSDGVVAPGFEPAALEILKQKKGGKYGVVAIHPDYIPAATESRTVFGITFEQKHNAIVPGRKTLQNIVTTQKDLCADAVRDLIVAQIALKYTQSNSVVFAQDGQIIGVGAGQQSRVHCTRLAGAKADRWFLRQHPQVLGLIFKDGISRPEKNNAIDNYLEDDLSPAEQAALATFFAVAPPPFTREQKRAWLDTLANVALASDAFFPFRDNIDRARRSGVRYVVQPGGSVRDDAVIAAANEYGMVMAFSGVRLFHH